MRWHGGVVKHACAVLALSVLLDVVRSQQKQQERAVAVVAEQLASSVQGYSTYRISIEFAADHVRDVYALYGETGRPLIVPPARQVRPPFGTDVGPTNPAFFALMPDAEYDSFLTIGTDGPALTPGSLSSVGLDFSAWTETQGVQSEEAAVFFIDPEHGATTEPVVFLQLTVPTGSTFRGQLSAQGRTKDGQSKQDWALTGQQFDQNGAVSEAPAAPPPPPPPPPALANTQHYASEPAALVAMSSSGSPESQQLLSSWTLDRRRPPCGDGWNAYAAGWRGIECNRANGNVETIYLAMEPSLSGDISSLGGLEYCTSIIMYETAVSGDVGGLGSMRLLNELDLSRTRVTGSIARLRGLRLRQLWLSDTAVTGDISALAQMTDLEWVDLSNSGVYGRLDSLRNLEHLGTLAVASTQVTGDLSALSSLGSMQTLLLTSSLVQGRTSSLGTAMHSIRQLCIGDTAISDDYQPSAFGCQENSRQLQQMTGYSCEQISRGGACNQLQAQGIGSLCGCSCLTIPQCRCLQPTGPAYCGDHGTCDGLTCICESAAFSGPQCTPSADTGTGH